MLKIHIRVPYKEGHPIDIAKKLGIKNVEANDNGIDIYMDSLGQGKYILDTRFLELREGE